MDDQDTAGPVILWVSHGLEGWSPTSFPTLKDALEAERYGQPFVITKRVDYEVTEKEFP